MKTSIKIKKFWYSNVAADGGLGDVWKEAQLGQRESTVQFNGSDASVNNYKNVLGDNLESSTSKGDKTLVFQLADLTPELIAEFTGGTVTTDASADSYDAPLNQNQAIEKSIKFLTDKNVEFRIPRVSFDGYPMINDDDLHYFQLNGTVLKPEKASTPDHGYDILKQPEANDILAFRTDKSVAAAVITPGTHTVTLVLPALSPLTTVIPVIGVSKGASISPEHGVATDFTAPKVYTITSANGTAQDWTVTITVS
jgi:hypothetical protein